MFQHQDLSPTLPDPNQVRMAWPKVLAWFKEHTGKEADLNGVLYLIGVQELGQGFRTFSKEEKEDLMQMGTCGVLQLSGHFTILGHDQDGWPLWEPAAPLPEMTVKQQEHYIKWHVIRYMKAEGLLE